MRSAVRVAALIALGAACSQRASSTDAGARDAVARAPCPDGSARCEPGCVDLRRDPAHCGACGTACALAHAASACVAAACAVLTCDEGYADCDGQPGNGCEADLWGDAHCGACGRACPLGRVCAAQGCVCPPPQIECDGACVDPRLDPQHCGRCGNACAPLARCQAGACACVPATLACGAELCADPSVNEAHCGGCGNACAPGLGCDRGACRAGAGLLAWVATYRGAGDAAGQGVAVDRAGNVYVAGRFTGTLELDGGASLTSAGDADVFVISLDASGALRWARSFGGAGADDAAVLRVSPREELVLAGSFQGELPLPTGALRSNGEQDIFVLRLGLDGTPRAARSYGGVGQDAPLAVAWLADGAFALGGGFQREVSFGGAVLRSGGNHDAFVVVTEPDGRHRFSRGIGYHGTELTRAIAARGDGVVIGGMAGFGSDFGRGPYAVDRPGLAFVAEYAPDGALRWSRVFHGGTQGGTTGVAVDARGDVYATLDANGAVDLGAGVTAPAGPSTLLLALGPDGGSVRWARAFTSSARTTSVRLARDAASGWLGIAGAFTDRLGWGAAPDLASLGGSDGFAAAVDDAGAVRWARRFGGVSLDAVGDLAMHAGGTYVVGSFTRDVDFGRAVRSAGAHQALFVARLTP